MIIKIGDNSLNVIVVSADVRQRRSRVGKMAVASLELEIDRDITQNEKKVIAEIFQKILNSVNLVNHGK